MLSLHRSKYRSVTILVFRLATALGLKCVDFSIIPPSDAEIRMDEVRRGHGYEGEVFYYVDGKDNVIGEEIVLLLQCFFSNRNSSYEGFPVQNPL